MAISGALDRSKHFSEFDEPYETQGGSVLTAAQRKALALAALGVTSTAAELNLVDGVTPGTVALSKAVIVDANKDIAGFRNVGATGTITHGGTDAAGVKGRYLSGVVVVAVPSIANDAAENIDSVAVSTAAMTFAAAVGDAVQAIPQEALPTDCVMLGAYVSATDEVTVVFGSKEGGGGVTGANKNFKFLFDDLT